ncbi:MAG: BolA family transcriptional regulator [Legionella sp.]|nr:MAG: BolA family transcriptional regulator [Legionella sp.]
MTRFQRIQDTLTQSLAPSVFELIDESHMHQVPKGAESHFKLTLVSEHFVGLTRIERHRLVNGLVASEFQKGLHAFTLALYSPEEWAKHPLQPSSPPCHREK